MAKTEYLEQYIQDLVRNYSKDYKIDLTDEETKTWFRHTLSEIDLLIHDRVRELVSIAKQESNGTFRLVEAEIRMLRDSTPDQHSIKSIFKRLFIDGQRSS